MLRCSRFVVGATRDGMERKGREQRRKKKKGREREKFILRKIHKQWMGWMEGGVSMMSMVVVFSL